MTVVGNPFIFIIGEDIANPLALLISIERLPAPARYPLVPTITRIAIGPSGDIARNRFRDA